MKKTILVAFTAFVLFIGNTASAQPYLGEIRMFAGIYAPNGWAKCEGQLLPISQNQALFSLLGTTYGGNGQTTFALPDLRGRVPMHYGTGPGLSPRIQGEMGGSESNTLTVAQMPSHSHGVNAVTADGNQNAPTNSLPANTKVLDKEYSSAAANTAMSAAMIAPAGGGQPVNNVQPFLTVTFIIALEGIYPTPD